MYRLTAPQQCAVSEHRNAREPEFFMRRKIEWGQVLTAVLLITAISMPAGAAGSSKHDQAVGDIVARPGRLDRASDHPDAA
jgi:hypothetical protein